MLPKSKPPETSVNHPPLRQSARVAQRRLALSQQLRFSSGLLLLLIVMVWGIDYTLLNSQLLLTRSMALGAALNWLAHTLFTWLVFRFLGRRTGRRMVNQLYIGQLLKWLVMLFGFSAILLLIKPLSTGALLSGFLLMQLGNFIALWRLR